jgi:GT2 family glycosyltransferase
MEVGAAIVSYNPSQPLLDLVKGLAKAGVPVEIVDNASTSGSDVLEECAAAGATIALLDTNTGVAGALARALDTSAAEWLLTFDQDSRLTPDLVEQLIHSPATTSARTAIVAPVVVDAQSGDLLQGDPTAGRWYPVERVLTSGSLCRVAALRHIGGFRADLVIDFVDWDLCVRLREAGWQVAVEPSAVLQHSIGRATAHVLPLLGAVSTSNHTADRQYYKYRNFLLLGRSGELAHDPVWSARTAVGLVLGVGKVLALENDRKAKIAAIAAGVRDGVAGRGGTRRRPSRGGNLLQPVQRPPGDVDGVMPAGAAGTNEPFGSPAAARTPVSVCMATYNGARYLRLQLDSVLAQLGPQDELLVQDDSSTDETLDIVASYADPRVEVLQNVSNLGVISTFERCLSRARRPIVLLCDQDDEWLPGKVDAMVAAFADPHVTGVVTDAVIVDEDGNLTGESIFAYLRSGPGVVHNYVKNSYLGCCLAVRREVLDVALPVPRAVRTHDGWIGITAEMLGEVVFLPTPYVTYRRHDANVSQMEPFGFADIARRRLALAGHLARISPQVLRRRAARAV